MISALHSGNAGDILWSLPWLRAMGGGELYLRLGMPAGYARGVIHPLGNVTLNAAMASALLPLLRCQPYITHADVWSGERITHWLDQFREQGWNMATHHLAKVYSYLWPVELDLSQPWLFLPEVEYHGKIVINRTQRYHGVDCDYRCLKPDECIFISPFKDEYDSFASRYFACEWRRPVDLLEAAKIIKGGRLYVGNQSACWVLAEALAGPDGGKLPRVLEVCPAAPNAGCNGPRGYECLNGAAWKRVHEMLA